MPLISDTTELDGVGLVFWTANQTIRADGQVVVTVLVDARGPDGSLGDADRTRLKRKLGFL
jgi:hypothetical protein